MTVESERQTTIYRGLTLTQPWASLVALGYKRWETRSWATRYRGPLVIHAAKRFPRDAQRLLYHEGGPFSEALNCPPEDLPRGAIIATAELADVVQTDHLEMAELTEDEIFFGDYRTGRFAWRLADVVKLPASIPFKGALGLWAVPEELGIR